MTTPNPPFHPLIEKLLQSQQRHLFFPVDIPVDKSGQVTAVVVGVSGGADSVCLLHLLYQLRQCWQLDLHVAHFDHAARPDSAEDCAFVGKLASQLELPFHFERRILESIEFEKISEAALRTARLNFLHTIAYKVKSVGQMPTLALAHHADDQAETIIFRLTRGASTQGMRGIQPVTKMSIVHLNEYVRIIRPLLDVRQSAILRYLHDHKLTWRDDPSNDEIDYARNRIRHRVLPELAQINPQVVDSIVRSAKLLDENAERLARLDRQLLQSLQLGHAEPERILLDLRQWQSLDQVEQRAVLQLALHDLLQMQQEQSELGFEQIEHLRQQLQLQQAASQAHPIVDDLVWSVVADPHGHSLQLSLHHSSTSPRAIDHPTLPNDFSAQPLQMDTTIALGQWSLQSTLIQVDNLPSDWQKNQNVWQVWLDADKVGEVLISTWVAGMQIYPLGMEGKSKSLGDFFTDRKIHPSERKSWPLLIDKASGEVIWVCGLTIAHSVRITKTTKRVLSLTWESRT